MRHLTKIALLLLATPLMALAADSYPYDGNINLPEKVTVSSQTSSATTEAQTTSSEQKEYPQEAVLNDDPGSTYIGSSEIAVYTVISNQKVPVRSARVTATSNQEVNPDQLVSLGQCVTNSNGFCQIRLHTPSTGSDLTENSIVNYLAEKNTQTGRTSIAIRTALNQKTEIIIEGLSQLEATEYYDWSIASNQNELRIPTTDGFWGGNSSILIAPTRFTMAGGKESLTAVGGVKFTLKIYYGSNLQGNNYQQPQYRTSTQAFFYSSQNSLGSLFSSLKKYTFSGTIPDNGTNSQLVVSNLPAGDYLLTLEKSGFLPTNIVFSLSEGEEKKIFPANIRPRKGAEPPSINQSRIRKKVEENIYWARIDNQEYMYRPDYPWYGWQNPNQYISQEPIYSIENGYSPEITVGSVTQGGYNVPWNMSPGGFNDYIQRCQTMNFGRGVDPEDAAIAAAIGGFSNWLFGNEARNLESFAETTLAPGLTTYFAAKAMQESGGSISISTGNADCFPQASSPYYTGNYWLSSPYSSRQYGRYNYPNGYQTNNIPNECRRCLTTPPIVYDPNWCPAYCNDYLEMLNFFPIIDLLRDQNSGSNFNFSDIF